MRVEVYNLDLIRELTFLYHLEDRVGGSNLIEVRFEIIGVGEYDKRGSLHSIVVEEGFDFFINSVEHRLVVGSVTHQNSDLVFSKRHGCERTHVPFDDELGQPVQSLGSVGA